MSGISNLPPANPSLKATTTNAPAKPAPAAKAAAPSPAPVPAPASNPESQIRDRRQTAGTKGAADFQKATADGKAAETTIKFGEPTDVTRPKLNTEAYLKSFDTKNTGLLNQDAFQRAFGIDPAKLDVPKLMRTVDQVDKTKNSTDTEPLVSIADALPLVGLFDNGGTGGAKGRLDAQITPQERTNAMDYLKGLLDSDPTRIAKSLTNLSFWYRNE